jgi:predicted GNAT family acetyltransferase
MKVLRYPSPSAFLDAAEPFLLTDEACHNLLLGIPARLVLHGGAATSVYLAAAADRNGIAAAAMMTPPWNVVLSKTAQPDAVRRLAEDVATIRPAPPGVNGPSEIAEQFAAAWRGVTGEETVPALRERIHRLDAVREVPSAPGRFRDAGADDRPFLIEWLTAFGEEAFPPQSRPPMDAGAIVDARMETRGEGIVLWDDRGPRCLAGYGSGTRNGIRIGPVYTPPEHRNRGYATACVAALSRRLLREGRRFCMLYTNVENPNSNRIYRRIGYEPVCEVAEFRFVRLSGL